MSGRRFCRFEIEELVKARSFSCHVTYPSMSGRRFCRFEIEELVKARSFSCHVRELVSMWSFENLKKTDVILSSEAEDMEDAMGSVVEATFWMD